VNHFSHIDPDRLRAGFGVKWGSLDGDTIGAWVADMDFGIPPAVRERVIEVVEREDFGYPFWIGEDPVVAAFQDRMNVRYGWTPGEGRTRVFTDLIQVLQVMIETTTGPGDGVAIHVPTYPPFLASIIRSGRRVVPIPMLDSDSGWHFHTDGLSETLRGCRLLVLVNPHNPTGRVFTRAELTAVAQAADDLDLVVLADEIHADLTYSPLAHIPFASLGPDVARRTITATSATKAFNLAAMRCAVTHIGADHVRARLDAAPLDYFGQPGILSRVATVAAWRESDEWLTGLMERLTDNRRIVQEWAVRTWRMPEATYLGWLNLPVTAEHIERLAKVKLSPGAEFSEGTDVDTADFTRLNFATSPGNLRRILERVGECLNSSASPDFVAT
jgi:cystathionine beta-lyase